MKVSLGICAYNEEKNIGSLLEDIISQEHSIKLIDEIIVVASGCTDNTVPIVKKYAKKDSRIQLITQKEREGKSAAFNIVLEKAKNNILVTMSADILLKKNTIKELVEPLKQEEIGMVGARIIPLNDKESLVGYAVYLQWQLHHILNMHEKDKPKIGEIVAFKKLFQRIPPSSAVDEANTEPLIHGQGYRIIYNPSAIIFNKGPETISDFLRQRRRIYAGHLAIKNRQQYTVSTFSGFRILKILFNYFPIHYKYSFLAIGTIILEVIGRVLGTYDYHIKTREHTVWEIAESTKDTANLKEAIKIKNT